MTSPSHYEPDSERRWMLLDCRNCRQTMIEGGTVGGFQHYGTCGRAERIEVVALADVIDVLDRAYHPQMGENPTHPADVIREKFPALVHREERKADG